MKERFLKDFLLIFLVHVFSICPVLASGSEGQCVSAPFAVFNSLIDQLSQYNGVVEKYLYAVEDNIKDLNELIENIEQCDDCSSEQSSGPQALQFATTVVTNEQGGQTTQVMSDPILMGLILTSVPLSIVLGVNGAMVCQGVHTAEAGEYTLQEGDHNIWFDENGHLWGYDKCGRMFKMVGNEREVMGSSECCTLFGKR